MTKISRKGAKTKFTKKVNLDCDLVFFDIKN